MGRVHTRHTTHTQTLHDRHNRQHYREIPTPQGNCVKLLCKVSSAAAEDIQSKSTAYSCSVRWPGQSLGCGNVTFQGKLRSQGDGHLPEGLL